MSSEKKSIWWLVASSAIFSLMAFLIRYAHYIDPFKTTLFRFAIGMAVLGSLAMSKKIKLDFNRKWILFWRGLIGGIAVFIFYWAIPNVGLARGTVIVHSAPIFASVIGIFALKEKMSLIKFLFICVALYGLYLIVGSEAFVRGGVSFYDFVALAGAFFTGIAYVLIKKARETESAYSVFFAQSVIGFWLVSIPANLTPVEMGIGGGVILLAIGFTATAGQLMMTHAYKYVTVSVGSSTAMLSPVFNFIIGLVFFREPFTARSLTGMLVVLVSCYVIVMADEYTRKLLGIMNRNGRSNNS